MLLIIFYYQNLNFPKKLNEIKLRKNDEIFSNKQKKGLCTGRESNPGRPRGRRAFYH